MIDLEFGTIFEVFHVTGKGFLVIGLCVPDYTISHQSWDTGSSQVYLQRMVKILPSNCVGSLPSKAKPNYETHIELIRSTNSLCLLCSESTYSTNKRVALLTETHQDVAESVASAESGSFSYTEEFDATATSKSEAEILRSFTD